MLAGTSASANIGTIAARPLTITADDQSRPFGQTNPPLTFGITSGNLVSGDILTGAPSTTATQNSAAGSYPITEGSLSATANYAVLFVDGALVVLPAPSAPEPVFVNFGTSPIKYIPPPALTWLPEAPGLTSCTPVNLASMLNQQGTAPLFGFAGGACGGAGN
jgi:hypothetical protein